MRQSTAHTIVIATALVAGATRGYADELPSLSPFAPFSDLQVTPLRLNGPSQPGGTTGLAVLDRAMQINHQFLPAGTILTMLGHVNGGTSNRVYAVDPHDGSILPDLSVSYAPAAADGKPDAGLIFVPGSGNRRFLGMQFDPMAITLAELEETGPGVVHDVAYLPTDLFPNGGGIALADENTLYLTSYATRSLYTIDFVINGNDLMLGSPAFRGYTRVGAGPDGVAIIPPNAAGSLKEYAGKLILARFGGYSDGFLDVIDTNGSHITHVAQYHRNNAIGFIGPDGVTFGPDGALYVSDFDRTIFRITPEPSAVLLLSMGAAAAAGRRRP